MSFPRKRESTTYLGDLMIKKVFLQVFVLAGACLFFMGMQEGADVVAYRYMQQGQYQQALQTYIQNGNNSGAGTVYCTLHMYDDALASFQKANDHSGMGMAYLGKHQYDTATTHFMANKDYSGA